MAVRMRIYVLNNKLSTLIRGDPLVYIGMNNLVRAWVDMLETPLRYEVRKLVASTLAHIVRDESCPEESVRIVFDHAFRYGKLLLEKKRLPMKEYNDMMLFSEEFIKRHDGIPRYPG